MEPAPPEVDRRTLLRAAGAGVGSAALASTGAASRQSDGPEPTVVFEDQETEGRQIVIAKVATDVDAQLYVRDSSRERVDRGVWNETRFDAGAVEEDVEVTLDDELTESQQLRASLVELNGSGIASDTAVVTVAGADELPREYLSPTLVDADPDAGFEYPYFLYVPGEPEIDPPPILVEPNNTGTSTDDFSQHREAAAELVDFSTGRYVADELAVPLLVPVFPRPRSDPVDWHHYVHQLDDTTMAIDGGPLERVDLQLLAMVEDARDRLADRGLEVDRDGIVMNGFSASGNFVDRFAALHPDEVTSITAGGLNGMPILPLEGARGHELEYHVGVADVEELTGEPFDLEAFRSVNQFLFMGAEDQNDTLPYDDAWTDDDLREVALEVYGQDMQEDRFPYAKAAYEQVDAAAVFRIYDGLGHTSWDVRDDIVEFHERSIAGEAASSIRPDLGGNVRDPFAHFVRTPQEPTVGERVAFDASGSSLPDDEAIETYEWSFGDGETATGERASHTYERAGGHNVVLTVRGEDGTTHESSAQVLVQERDEPVDDGPTDDSVDATSNGSTADDAGPDNDSAANRSARVGDDDSLPGFGLATALAGLGSAACGLLGRLRADDG